MTEPVDHRGYPTKPRKLGERAWFYEQPGGILIYASSHASFPAVQIATLSWQRLEAAVDRRRALKRKAKRP